MTSTPSPPGASVRSAAMLRPLLPFGTQLSLPRCRSSGTRDVDCPPQGIDRYCSPVIGSLPRCFETAARPRQRAAHRGVRSVPTENQSIPRFAVFRGLRPHFDRSAHHRGLSVWVRPVPVCQSTALRKRRQRSHSNRSRIGPVALAASSHPASGFIDTCRGSQHRRGLPSRPLVAFRGGPPTASVDDFSSLGLAVARSSFMITS